MPNKESQYAVELDDLYRDLILDHYRRPRNQGTLADASVVAEGMNPSCGDEIRVSVRMEDGVVRAIRFAGTGCSISQSSASMMAEETEGLAVADVRRLLASVQAMLTSNGFDPDAVDIGDLEALQGVAKFPVRIKCALLAWKVLEQALAQATGTAIDTDTDIQTRIAQA